jgi:hypothetical protein
MKLVFFRLDFDEASEVVLLNVFKILNLLVSERFNQHLSDITQVELLEYEITHQLYIASFTFDQLTEKLKKIHKVVF